VPPEMVLPVFVVVVLAFALLISYPWEVLSVSAVIYLASLPFGWLSYRDYVRKDALAAGTAATASAPAGDAPPSSDAAAPAAGTEPGTERDRPARLN